MDIHEEQSNIWGPKIDPSERPNSKVRADPLTPKRKVEVTSKSGGTTRNHQGEK